MTRADVGGRYLVTAATGHPCGARLTPELGEKTIDSDGTCLSGGVIREMGGINAWTRPVNTLLGESLGGLLAPSALN